MWKDAESSKTLLNRFPAWAIRFWFLLKRTAPSIIARHGFAPRLFAVGVYQFTPLSRSENSQLFGA
jgi:hypothetical protein